MSSRFAAFSPPTPDPASESLGILRYPGGPVGQSATRGPANVPQKHLDTETCGTEAQPRRSKANVALLLRERLPVPPNLPQNFPFLQTFDQLA